MLRREWDHPFALAAKASDQPLSLGEGEGIGEEVGRHAHRDEAAHGAQAVVGVQGGEHEVAGERGVDRGAGGFLVAALADKNDVGVGPHEAAQALAEVDVVHGIGLGLVETLHFVFDRVLDGLDVDVLRVDTVE